MKKRGFWIKMYKKILSFDKFVDLIMTKYLRKIEKCLINYQYLNDKLQIASWSITNRWYAAKSGTNYPLIYDLQALWLCLRKLSNITYFHKFNCMLLYLACCMHLSLYFLNIFHVIDHLFCNFCAVVCRHHYYWVYRVCPQKHGLS